MRSASESITPIACALALSAACGQPVSAATPYAVVSNGGLGPAGVRCDPNDASIELGAERVAAYAGAAAPECAAPASNPVQRVDVEATYAMFHTALSARLVGPVISTRDEIALLPLIAAGGDARGLAAGGETTALAAGGDQRELAAGSDQQALAADGGRRELASGGNTRALDTGAGGRELAAGSAERELGSGADQRALEAGADVVPAISLRKSVSQPRVHEGQEAAFSLELLNDSSQTLERIVLLDRVDALLAVVDAPGAQPYRLDDGTTLLVWDDRAPLRVGERRRYSIRFRARARGGM